MKGGKKQMDFLKVEAGYQSREVMPVQPLLEYTEQRKLKSRDRPLHARYIVEEDKTEHPERRPNKKKKRKTIKHKNVKATKKSKHTHKNKATVNKQKENKHWVPEIDRKFDNSESKQSDNKGKPVDIIVHIKMSE